MKAYSLKQLALLMVGLLLLVTVGSSLFGTHLIQHQFETEQDRDVAEAQRHVQQVAATIGNQIAFYQGIVDIAARRRQVVDLLAFGEEDEAISWSLAMRELLPYALGAALAHPDGEVIGDPLVQRVGDLCRLDLHRFVSHRADSYPPVHTAVPGLEHFDILGRIDTADSADSGVVMISFHLESLIVALNRERRGEEALQLITDTDKVLATAGRIQDDMQRYISPVAGTNWMVHLYRPPVATQSAWVVLMSGNIVIVALVAIIVAVSTRRFARMINHDVGWIHESLSSLLDGSFVASKRRPVTKEVSAILPDIEGLARQLQAQTENLRAKTLTDPLTGLHNRRHFDVIVEHAYERSRRQVAESLLLVDVNEFKIVNDQLGHKAGDEILIHIAQTLKSLTRAGDEVARLGGDEFAIVLHDIAPRHVEQWLYRFVARFDAVMRDFRPDELSSNVCSLSIGAAPISSSLFDDAHGPYDAADQAMYTAKRLRTGLSRFAIDRSLKRAASHISTASTTNLSSAPGDKLSNG